VVLAWIAAGHTAAAQTAGPLAPRPGQQSQQPERPIRVRVELVSTPAVVHDSKGELVLDLTRGDFRVFDNGLEQSVEENGFEMGGAPISVAIVVETSSRIEALLPAIRRTGILFTQTVLGESGDAAIIGFHDEVSKLLDFTGDHEAIERTISRLNHGTSGTRLYDALSQAVSLLKNRPADRRRVIITLAEATDTGSEEKLGDILREAQLANITIYSVGLSTTAAELRGAPRSSSAPAATPPGTISLPPRPGTVQTPTTEAQRSGSADLLALAIWVIQHATEPIRENALELAAAATGGLHQSGVRDRSIETAIDQIGGELHAQYTLSYRPSGTEAGYHEIKVMVNRSGVQVRSRPGYYLGASAN
jgi:VWFA-related protein